MKILENYVAHILVDLVAAGLPRYLQRQHRLPHCRSSRLGVLYKKVVLESSK